MRYGHWKMLAIVLGVFAVFAFRTLSASKPIGATEATITVEESDSGYTEHEMIEYRYRANMPRHWRYVVLGK